MADLPHTAQRWALAPGQQQLWFLHRIAPASPAYNISTACTFTGDFDEDALRGALDALLQRHEMLRASVHDDDGVPYQVVREECACPLRIVDLREYDAEARGDMVQRVCDEEARTPFDLTAAPLLRALLVRHGAAGRTLVLTVHHIVGDGLSMEIALADLAALYAVEAGAGAPLPELEIDYLDYVEWQRTNEGTDAYRAALGYWSARFAELPPPVLLPADRPRPSRPSYAGAFVRHTVPAAVTAAVRAFAERARVTPAAVYFAAFFGVLHRIAAVDDVTVGLLTATRGLPELERIIGYFVNTLPIRANVTAAVPFESLVAQVGTAVLEGLAHQDVPFERIVSAVGTARAPSHYPLIRMVFGYNDLRGEPFRFPGVETERFAVESGTAKWEIALTVNEHADGATLRLDYATDLFDDARIQRFVRSCANVLADGVRRPATAVGSLRILDDAERAAILRAGNHGARAIANPEVQTLRFELVHDAISARCAASPERLAVRSGDDAVTYEELGAITDRLAARLRSAGVGPRSHVGICLGQSVRAVLAIVAILKCGAAWVPLDPAHPAERLRYVMGAAEIGVVFSAGGSAADDMLRADERLTVLDVDAERARGGPAPAFAPPEIEPADLAYVIYTSGSTGTPKGVAVEHRQAMAFLRSTSVLFRSLYPHDPATWTWLATTALSFDVSVFEVLWCLVHGTCLVLPGSGSSETGGQLAERSARILTEGVGGKPVTVFSSTPSMAALLASRPAVTQALRRVHIIYLGGEIIPKDFIDKIVPEQDGYVVNGYGPTEITVACHMHVLRAGDEGNEIGALFPHVAAYVVNERMELQPAGVAGELLIGGPGVARGYLAQPELTAKGFIRNPFGESDADRVYRTGDIVDVAPDRIYRYYGRFDDQVKVRGYRIELREVEAALLQHPDVRSAVAYVRPDAQNVAHLVAAVVLDRGVRAGAIVDEELLPFVRRRLPEQMVPESVVAMDEIPLNRNGKVDRAALRALSAAPVAAAPARVSAPGSLHAQLRGVWRRVLEHDDCTADTNFFDAGGKSLLLVRLQTLLARELGRDVAMLDLFQYPSITAFAEFLERGGASDGAAERGALRAARRADRR